MSFPRSNAPGRNTKRGRPGVCGHVTPPICCRCVLRVCGWHVRKGGQGWQVVPGGVMDGMAWGGLCAYMWARWVCICCQSVFALCGVCWCVGGLQCAKCYSCACVGAVIVGGVVAIADFHNAINNTGMD